MIVAICILSILLIAALFANVNLLRKLERVDDSLIEYITALTKYKNRLTNMYNTVKDLDSRGAFESDDEAGSIFKEIKSTIDEFEKEFSVEEEINE